MKRATRYAAFHHRSRMNPKTVDQRVEDLWRYAMLELTRKPHTEGMTDMCLRVPTLDAQRISNVIRDVLAQAERNGLKALMPGIVRAYKERKSR